jgi:aminodeoxyfutalosine synthase
MNEMVAVDFEQLSETLAAGAALSALQLRDLADSRDLIGLGMLAADVRTRWHGTQGTFVRVAVVDVSNASADAGGFGLDLPHVGADGSIEGGGTFAMGELRLVGAPSSLDAARVMVAAAARQAGVPVSAWSVDALASLGPLADVARTLREAGLHAVASARVDRLSVADLEALAAAGLPLQTVTLGTPLDGEALLDALEQVRAWQAATGVVRACCPLPVDASAEQPTTGYDDMRHVALARIVLDNVAHIQAHWARLGAKLSQACLLFGADDLDAVPAHDALTHGPRRAILEEVRRNLVAASLEPVERDGAFAVRPEGVLPGSPA